MLHESGAFADVAGVFAEDGGGGLDEVPGPFRFGAGGEGIVDPDKLDRFGDDAWIGGGGFGVLDGSQVGAQFVGSCLLLVAEVSDLLFSFGRHDAHDGGGVFFVAVQGRAVNAVEVGVEGVELFHGDGIKLVIVTAGAVHGEAHEDGARGDHAIDDVADVHFFGDGTAFAGGDVAAIETGRDELIVCGIVEEVTGQLFGGEDIERFVGVEGTDDPVAVGPHFAVVVQVQTVSVAKAGGVQPVAAHVFAVVG